MIRNNKLVLFSALGFTGGMGGAVLAEIAMVESRTPAGVIVQSTIWAALLASAIATALFVASEIYHRRRNYASRLCLQYFGGGAIAGAIGGSIAQMIFNVQLGSEWMQQLVFRPMCWGVMGGILGWRMATTIPNLDARRAAIAGALGGTVGGVAFLVAAVFLPATIGRMIGIGLLGASLGMALVVADALFREATLEITWAPNEVTTVALGEVPVTIGGGDDHVHVAGLPPSTATVLLENGNIQYVDSGTGRRTALRDGSKIKIGPIEIVVRATS